MNIFSVAKPVFSFLFFTALLLSAGCKKEKTPNNERFIGVYQVEEMCETDMFSYNMEIVAEPTGNDNQVIINNFGNFGLSLTAEVDGNNITLDDAIPGDSFIMGSGSLESSTLTFTYDANLTGFTDTCTLTGTKQ